MNEHGIEIPTMLKMSNNKRFYNTVLVILKSLEQNLTWSKNVLNLRIQKAWIELNVFIYNLYALAKFT